MGRRGWVNGVAAPLIGATPPSFSPSGKSGWPDSNRRTSASQTQRSNQAELHPVGGNHRRRRTSVQPDADRARIRVRVPMDPQVFAFDAPRLLLAFALAACAVVV